MAINLSVDLETYGTRPDAAILSIGAVPFDLTTGALGKLFYINVDLQNAIEEGGTVDDATVNWWKTQKAETFEALKVDAVPIRYALAAFTSYCDSLGKKSEIFIWGNGADFDNVILTSAYRNVNMPIPWGKYNNRCYRTVKSMYPTIKIVREGTYHNALDDAVSQAKHLIAMLNPWGQSALKIPA